MDRTRSPARTMKEDVMSEYEEIKGKLESWIHCDAYNARFESYINGKDVYHLISIIEQMKEIIFNIRNSIYNYKSFNYKRLVNDIDFALDHILKLLEE